MSYYLGRINGLSKKMIKDVYFVVAPLDNSSFVATYTLVFSPSPPTQNVTALVIKAKHF